MKITTLAVIILLPATAGTCAARGCDDTAPQDPRTTAAMLLRGEIFAGAVSTGDVQTIVAGADAEVEQVHVAAGARSPRGAPLMTLAAPEVEDELRAATQLLAERDAARRSVQANLRLIDSRLARRQRNPELFAAEEREALRHERESLAAALEGAEAAARRAAIDRARAQARNETLSVISSHPGVVLAVLVGRGQRVARGAPLLRVATGAEPHVRFVLPADRAGIAVGSRVCVLPDHAAPAVPARIFAIGSVVDPLLGGHVASASVEAEHDAQLANRAQQSVLVQPMPGERAD